VLFFTTTVLFLAKPCTRSLYHARRHEARSGPN